MRKAKEILRLKYELGLTNRQIARSCRVSHVTVSKYLRRAEAAGIGWPLLREDEGAAETTLQAARPGSGGRGRDRYQRWELSIKS
jgi:transcriptional regulator with XRE-family HTH domain